MAKPKVTAAQKKASKGFKDRTAGQKADVKSAFRGARKQIAGLAGLSDG